MNWTAAHKISNNAFSIGAGWEARVLALFVALAKDKKLSTMDKALLLTYLQKELDKIAQEELLALDNVTQLAYNYTRNATLIELSNITGTFPALAKGYTANWCVDGKDYTQRVMANIANTKAELAGLLIGWQGDDPIVLMGLIHDILTKAQNEWKRLIRTELEAAFSQASRDANLMKGARYAVIENDSPCDEICAEMVGEHEVSLDGVLGLDLPPYHPNCQCVFLGIFSDFQDISV